jgi:hypothetical protein
MDNSGVDTNECGAYCLFDIDKPDGEGGIRYEEFVALNTWQIQRLKSRVAQLEKIVADLSSAEE